MSGTVLSDWQIKFLFEGLERRVLEKRSDWQDIKASLVAFLDTVPNANGKVLVEHRTTYSQKPHTIPYGEQWVVHDLSGRWDKITHVEQTDTRTVDQDKAGLWESYIPTLIYWAGKTDVGAYDVLVEYALHCRLWPSLKQQVQESAALNRKGGKVFRVLSLTPRAEDAASIASEEEAEALAAKRAEIARKRRIAEEEEEAAYKLEREAAAAAKAEQLKQAELTKPENPFGEAVWNWYYLDTALIECCPSSHKEAISIWPDFANYFRSIPCSCLKVQVDSLSVRNPSEDNLWRASTDPYVKVFESEAAIKSGKPDRRLETMENTLCPSWGGIQFGVMRQTSPIIFQFWNENTFSDSFLLEAQLSLEVLVGIVMYKFAEQKAHASKTPVRMSVLLPMRPQQTVYKSAALATVATTKGRFDRHLEVKLVLTLADISDLGEHRVI